ncbi:MAG: sulfotransferase domain-containing protein [Ignavibacteriae bacterium]|nr:sulfotransferase domain-containing protein [Ignavibacteriota bacterium]
MKKLIIHFIGSLLLFLFNSQVLAFTIKLPEVQKEQFPGILFNTLPKSGSIYITKRIAQGLNIKVIKMGVGYFPKDLIILPQIEELSFNGCFAQEHLDPSPMNLQILKKYLPKFIVHVRDPRQAILSLVHHFNTYKKLAPQILYRTFPVATEKYFSLTLEKQIDWVIKNYFPAYIEWILGWIEAQEKGDLLIKFTTYEDFLENEDAFYEKILEFYNIPFSKFKKVNIPKDSSLHFRKGEKEEWRSVFTEKQQQWVTAQMPEMLFDLFPWEP